MMKTLLLFAFILGTVTQASPPAPGTALDGIFVRASQKYEVPLQLLQAIALVESHWRQHQPAVEEVLGNEHPKVYGVMGLKDDSWFGHSLKDAAKSIGHDANDLVLSSELNIMGAAALLHSYQGARSAKTFEEWTEALRKFSGIPGDSEATLYVHDVFKVLRDGYDANGISIASAHVEIPAFARATEPRATQTGGDQTELSVDWDPSGNLTPGAINPQYVVIHDTESAFPIALSWLKNPSSNVSAHYIIRSSDGYIKQLVSQRDRAWHARCWNVAAIGIEHEGYYQDPSFFTDEMYRSSAQLVRRITDKYDIPVDAQHIFGHNFGQNAKFKTSPVSRLGNCNDHLDPGRFWDWDYFFKLVVNAD